MNVGVNVKIDFKTFVVLLLLLQQPKRDVVVVDNANDLFAGNSGTVMLTLVMVRGHHRHRMGPHADITAVSVDVDTAAVVL